MPDMNDLSNWAARRADDKGAAPSAPADGNTEEQSEEPQNEFTGEEPQEAMEFVAKECQDALEALKKIRDKLEDAGVADELVESLQACADKATEAAEGLAEAAEENAEEEPEEEQE
jgi:hypothetical protein